MVNYLPSKQVIRVRFLLSAYFFIHYWFGSEGTLPKGGFLINNFLNSRRQLLHKQNNKGFIPSLRDTLDFVPKPRFARIANAIKSKVLHKQRKLGIENWEHKQKKLGIENWELGQAQSKPKNKPKLSQSESYQARFK